MESYTEGSDSNAKEAINSVSEAIHLVKGAFNLSHLRGKHFGILIALYHLNFHRCVDQSYALWHHDLHPELQLTHSMLMFAMSEVRALA